MTIRINHSRSTALERSVKYWTGSGRLNRFYMYTTLAPGSKVQLQFLDDGLKRQHGFGTFNWSRRSTFTLQINFHCTMKDKNVMILWFRFVYFPNLHVFILTLIFRVKTRCGFLSPFCLLITIWGVMWYPCLAMVTGHHGAHIQWLTNPGTRTLNQWFICIIINKPLVNCLQAR